MWASTEAAKKAANGTHIAIRIGNLQFYEGSSEQSRLDLMVKGLLTLHRALRRMAGLVFLLVFWVLAGAC